MKKMRNDNKGFTLVELIVVLVILAILAAILVPALLGYIDEARNKQLQLHGKSIYTAAQSVASKAYGKNTDIHDNSNKTKRTVNGTADSEVTYAQAFGFDVAELSEILSFQANKKVVNAYVVFEDNSGKKGYTIKDIIYSEDGDSSAVQMKNSDESWKFFATQSEVTTMKGTALTKPYILISIDADGNVSATYNAKG